MQKSGPQIVLVLLTLIGVSVPSFIGIRLLAVKPPDPSPTPELQETEAVIQLPSLNKSEVITSGITRRTELRTELPERPRFSVYRYTVQIGDTPWAIAEKFNLNIESVLWGNEGMNADAGALQPEQVINILPVDGVLHTAAEGDTLNRLELLHGTPVQDIQEFMGNELEGWSPEDSLPVGQKIIVPGGRNAVIWQEPGPRVVPGKGRNSPGFYSGPLIYTGSGFFDWPVSPIVITQPYWSSHPAIDIDTYYRQPVFASDSGTVIFAGWSKSGYGNLIIMDHGNGYWTYYAHNSFNLVDVGQGILQGQQIAESGSSGNSTGDHLDFRIRTAEGSFLNPTEFLP